MAAALLRALPVLRMLPGRRPRGDLTSPLPKLQHGGGRGGSENGTLVCCREWRTAAAAVGNGVDGPPAKPKNGTTLGCSNASPACVCVCARVCVCVSLSHVQLGATPWTAALQAALSMGFSRQGYCSGLPFPPPGESSRPGDQTHISCIGRQVLYHGATCEAYTHTHTHTHTQWNITWP